MTVAAAGLGPAVARASRALTLDAIRSALAELVAVPAANGAERVLAERLAAWGARAHPGLEWRVDALDEQSANLVITAARGKPRRELAFYSHLDTSLTGDLERDRPITGATEPPPPFREEAGELRGFGVGVAKAPSAAAIAALACASAALRELGAAHRLTLFLASGGTHRAVPRQAPTRFGRGVAHALERGWRPDAVVNVKGGPGGVLYEEPATAYLRVRVRSRWSAALARATSAPDGGLARHTGAVVDAIEEWRAVYLRAHPPSGQLACEIAIGALRAGSPEKADLVPGLLEVFVYAVLPPDADPAHVAGELAEFVRPRVAGLADAPAVDADAYASASGGRTDPASEVVALARAAWAAHVGSDPDGVRGWTGATDGTHFMAAGIPTVRLGAPVGRDAADPRVEIVRADDLVTVARAWTEVAVRYSAG